MKNLQAKYKKILKKIFEENEYEIPDFDKKTTYNTIIKIYNKIDQIFKENEFDIYEINNIINSDNIDCKNIKKLKKFIYIRNKNILQLASNTKLWKDNIKNIMKYCKETHNFKPSFNLAENAFIELEKKFILNWLGFWSTIEITNNGKIKDINIFDMKEYEFIVDYISKNNL